jgi:hypothetical protein
LKKKREREIAKRPFNVPEIKHFLTSRKLFIESMLTDNQEVD